MVFGARDLSDFIAQAIPPTEKICIHYEGIYLSPYLCPASVPTIGIGTTVYPDGRRVTLKDKPITKDHAIALLRFQLRTDYIPSTLNLCPSIEDPDQLAAITDFTYNCGVSALRASTLRRRILAGRWEDVPTELRKWVHGGGRRLRGLALRRESEVELVNPAWVQPVR